MSDGDATGVHITDGQSSIRLRRRWNLEATDYLTLIEIEAGPFKGAVLQELGIYQIFRRELLKLYETLSGKTGLSGPDVTTILLTGNGSGLVLVDATTTTQLHPSTIRLEFSFQIDQTYLPNIIKQIDKEFL